MRELLALRLRSNLDEFVVNNEEGEETELGLRLDGRRDFGGETPMFVKFGVNLRQKEKESQVDSVEYEVPSGFTFGNNNQGPGEYPFLRVPRIDPERVKSAFYASNSGFEGEELVLDSAIDDWTSNEDVYAA
ncbi:MAG: hypothetical protein HC841_03640, partial [Verrucomicrobiae bacterium]|nr:hypothetical protein [Verrucomicrobiae bacterium]